MNIFDLYLDKIITIIKKAKSDGVLLLPENLNAINVDVPPQQFDCDISTNVAMVLSKLNNKTPVELAEQLIKLINNDNDIEELTKNINIEILKKEKSKNFLFFKIRKMSN